MSDITLEVGTQLLFNDSSVYVPLDPLGSIELATPTDVEINLIAVADTEARESAKADLTANRALAYSVMVCMEMAATPTTGEPINFYWAPSPTSVAGDGNPGEVSGLDQDYTGGGGTLAEGLAQLQFIGTLICSNQVDSQVAIINPRFEPSERYGSLVVENQSGAVIATDAIETAVAFTPIVGDVA